MQDRTNKNSLIFARLEAVRERNNWTWDRLASVLGVNRSLFYHVKADRNSLSRKVLAKLEEEEKKAGIQRPEEAPPVESPLMGVTLSLMDEQHLVAAGKRIATSPPSKANLDVLKLLLEELDARIAERVAKTTEK